MADLETTKTLDAMLADLLNRDDLDLLADLPTSFSLPVAEEPPATPLDNMLGQLMAESTDLDIQQRVVFEPVFDASPDPGIFQFEEDPAAPVDNIEVLPPEDEATEPFDSEQLATPGLLEALLNELDTPDFPEVLAEVEPQAPEQPATDAVGEPAEVPLAAGGLLESLIEAGDSPAEPQESVEQPQPATAEEEQILPTVPLIADETATARRTDRHDRSQPGRLHLVFAVSGEWFAIAANATLRTDRTSRITPVPSVPDWVAGIGTSRGDVFWMLDSHRLLGFPTQSATSGGTKVLVLRTPDRKAIGLLVDEIRGTATFDPQQQPESQNSAGPQHAPIVRNLVSHSGTAVKVIDPQALFVWISERQGRNIVTGR